MATPSDIRLGIKQHSEFITESRLIKKSTKGFLPYRAREEYTRRCSDVPVLSVEALGLSKVNAIFDYLSLVSSLAVQ